MQIHTNIKKSSTGSVRVVCIIGIVLSITVTMGSNAIGIEAKNELLSSDVISSRADYSKFSHSTPSEHAALMGRERCGSCHRASGRLAPGFPQHRDCTNCHLVQFTTGSASVNPICTICHTKEDINSANPAQRLFSSLRTFNAKFDHGQHIQGVPNAKPEAGCSACHVPTRNGIAQAIPAGLDAHRVCYECHAPGKQASSQSSCGYCHSIGSYSRTSTNARAYRLAFRHSSHRGTTCENCHRIKGRGLPQSQQVSSILPVQHLVSSGGSNCKTCHNGRRSFGDIDTRDCKRCHRRDGFRMSTNRSGQRNAYRRIASL